MTPPNRQTIAGQVYLDLRRLAQTTGRATDELLQLYALEGAELSPKETRHFVGNEELIGVMSLQSLRSFNTRHSYVHVQCYGDLVQQR